MDMVKISKIIGFILIVGIILFMIKNHMTRREFYRGDSVLKSREEIAEYIDRAYIVEKSEKALDVRLNMLNDAEEFVDIAYYKIDTGDTSKIYLAKVLETAERGVKVRIYLDGILNNLKGKMKDANYAFGFHPNIEYKLHYPISPSNPLEINNRLHDKIMIVDNKLALIGGRNIGDRFFVSDESVRNPVYDRDILIYNKSASGESVIRDMRFYFDQLWNCKGANEKYNNLSEAEIKKGRNFLLRIVEGSKDMILERLEDLSEINWEELTRPVKQIQFVHNDINDRDSAICFQGILELAEKAKEEMIFQSPYIVISDNARSVADEYDLDYGLIKILTNSYYSTPNVMANSGYHSIRKDIVDKTSEVYEYHKENSIHGKSYIFDEETCVIGSFNIDPRSMFLSTEAYMVIHDEEMSMKLKSNMMDLMDDSIKVRKDNYEYESDYEYKNTLLYGFKKLGIRILSKISRLFDYLL